MSCRRGRRRKKKKKRKKGGERITLGAAVGCGIGGRSGGGRIWQIIKWRAEEPEEVAVFVVC